MTTSLPGFQVVFPAPPPTTNDLTPQQRTQLVRQTRKIEQLLGTAPRLVDTSIRPIHISFPNGLSQRDGKGRRSSFDSTSSGSSSGSMPPIQRSFSLSNTIHPINSKTGSNDCSNSLYPSEGHFQSCPYDNTAPLLRLAMGSMTLETIPASPTGVFFSDPFPPLPLASSNDEPVFPLTTPDVLSPRISAVLQARAPSSNSLRKQKMDRVRKRLGCDVPFDLVFPNSKDNDRTENTPPRNGLREKERLPALRIPKKHAGRITTSRESISDAASIHRARRQVRATASAKDQLKHKKSNSEPPSLPTQPSPDDCKKFKQRLSCIVESPDEHWFGAYSEDLVSPRGGPDSMETGWTMQSHEAEFSFWSTMSRRQGWESDESSLSAPSLSPISTSSLSNTSESNSNATESPITPASSVSPDPSPSPSSSPIVTKTTTTSGEVKKRPPSYRKPPPPIPLDCC